MLTPRSLFTVEDDGLIKRLDLSDCEAEDIMHSDYLNSSALFTSSPVNRSDRSPIEVNSSLSSVSDEDRMNSSTDSISSFYLRKGMKRLVKKVPKATSRVVPSPPCRKVRALRLFGSPQSPKSLLKQSELSTVEAKNRIRPRLFPGKYEGVYDTNHNLNVSRHLHPFRSPVLEANVNPFCKTEIFVTSTGKRRRDSGLCGNSLDESSDKLNDNELENEIQPTKRIHFGDRDKPLSRYENEFFQLEEVGSGMFGSVYRCINRLDGCEYAIKKSRKPLKGTSDERTALNEVYAHAVLGHHKHVVRYFSAWAEDDHMLIQNEFCDGGSLAQAIEEKAASSTRFPESEVKKILLHIALGLRYIHSLNLAHMDIKPGNIFIVNKSSSLSTCSSDDGFEEDTTDEELTYKIGDLGHVTSVSNPEVEEGDCRYMPAELLRDDYRYLPKADIFALGLSIFEVCGGGPLPKNGDDWHSIRQGNLPYLPYYSKELNELIKQMIHPEPELRPCSGALVQNETLVPYVRKTKEQLNRELNAEKLKNEVLSRQLKQAAQKAKEERMCRLLGGKFNRSSSVTF